MMALIADLNWVAGHSQTWRGREEEEVQEQRRVLEEEKEHEMPRWNRD